MSQYPPKELLAFLKRFDPQIRELTLSVREFVLAEMAPPHEYILNVSYALALGYGPTERMKDTICIIVVYSKHVNLAFNQGTELDDPHRLLRGTGKKMRHVTIKTEADLSHPGIRELLGEAWEHAGLGLADRSQTKKVISAIKGGSAKKRSVTPGRRQSRD